MTHPAATPPAAEQVEHLLGIIRHLVSKHGTGTNSTDPWDRYALAALAPAERAEAVPDRSEILDRVLGDRHRGWLTVRDIAYTAFMRGAAGKNPDDGGPCDWFTDTLPVVDAGIAKIRETLAPLSAAPTRAGALDAAGAVERIVREVAELPDRSSPADWPDAMLVTADELRAIIGAALAAGDGAGE